VLSFSINRRVCAEKKRQVTTLPSAQRLSSRIATLNYFENPLPLSPTSITVKIAAAAAVGVNGVPLDKEERNSLP
jgi:hypothetical protein